MASGESCIADLLSCNAPSRPPQWVCSEEYTEPKPKWDGESCWRYLHDRDQRHNLTAVCLLESFREPPLSDDQEQQLSLLTQERKKHLQDAAEWEVNRDIWLDARWRRHYARTVLRLLETA